MTFKSFLEVNFSDCLNHWKRLSRHQVQEKMKHTSTFKYMSFTAHIVPDVWLPFGKMCLFPPPHLNFLRALAFKTRQKGRWERRAVPILWMGCHFCSHPVSEPGRNAEFIWFALHTRAKIPSTASLINGLGTLLWKGAWSSFHCQFPK